MVQSLMATEMAEQPAVLSRLIARFESDVTRVQAVLPQPLAGIVFVARGSSDHAAVFGRYLTESSAGRPAHAMRNEVRSDRLRSLTKEEKPCHTE